MDLKRELYTESGSFGILKDHWGHLIEESSSNEIFLTNQWQGTWWKHFGKDKTLRLVAFSNGEEDLLGLASFSIELSTNGKRVMRFLGGTDITDYLDVIAKSGYEESVCKSIVDFWKDTEDEWDFIDLHCLKETSITLNILKQLLNKSGYIAEVSIEEVCPKVSLPASWEEYLETLSKKDRHELRRKVRRIEKFSESADNYGVKSSYPLAEGIERFLLLHRKSDLRKKDFMNRNMELFFQDVTGMIFAENWLKLSFLHIDGTFIASSMSFDYQNKVYLYNSGYDPEYSTLSPGIVLVAHLIREAIDTGRSEFDFLRGNESYKYHLGGKDSNIYNMVISKVTS
ncbi:MAG: GNAT family N-acetyltransferase [Nitrospiraceae bacterium]|nr:MAG: GNAT family N-acetyltransferase [Nitrospiraceae bacterium]